jgi:hypothetical protein
MQYARLYWEQKRSLGGPEGAGNFGSAGARTACRAMAVDVRYWGQTGKDMLTLSSSPFGPKPVIEQPNLL